MKRSAEKKMTLGKGANPPKLPSKIPAMPKAKAKRASGAQSMMSGKPFELKPKKPEPDDRPRPARPPSTNKNSKSQNSARVKRLTGVML